MNCRQINESSPPSATPSPPPRRAAGASMSRFHSLPPLVQVPLVYVAAHLITPTQLPFYPPTAVSDEAIAGTLAVIGGGVALGWRNLVRTAAQIRPPRVVGTPGLLAASLFTATGVNVVTRAIELSFLGTPEAREKLAAALPNNACTLGSSIVIGKRMPMTPHEALLHQLGLLDWTPTQRRALVGHEMGHVETARGMGLFKVAATTFVVSQLRRGLPLGAAAAGAPLYFFSVFSLSSLYAELTADTSAGSAGLDLIPVLEGPCAWGNHNCYLSGPGPDGLLHPCPLRGTLGTSAHPASQLRAKAFAIGDGQLATAHRRLLHYAGELGTFNFALQFLERAGGVSNGGV